MVITAAFLFVGTGCLTAVSDIMVENELKIVAEELENADVPVYHGETRSSRPQVKSTVTLNAGWSAYRNGMGWNWHPQGMTWDPIDNVLVISLQGTSTLYKVNTAGTKVGESSFSHSHQTGVACDGASYYVADYTGNSGYGPLIQNNKANGNNELARMNWYGGAPLVYANGHLYYGDPAQSAYSWQNINRLKKATTNNPANALQTITTSISGIGDIAFDGRDFWILEYTYTRNSHATIHRVDLNGVTKETFTNIYRAGQHHIPSGLAYANGNLYLFCYSEVQGQGSTLTTITGVGLSVYTERAALIDPTDDEQICYTRYKPYVVSVNITSSMDLDDASELKVYLDYNTTNATLCYNWSREEFFKLQDVGQHVEFLSDNCTVANDSVDRWWVNFSVIFNFSFPHEKLVDCFVNTTATTGEYSIDRFPYLFKVENDMELVGTSKFTGEYQGELNENDWIRGGENITVSNLTVRYAGSSGVYPDDSYFNVKLTDSAGDAYWDNESSREEVEIIFPSRNITDMEEEYSIAIVNIPGGGICMTNLTYPLKIDAEAPLPPLNLLCHAESYKGRETKNTNRAETFVTWDEVEDTASGLAGYYYSQWDNSGTLNGSYTVDREVELDKLPEGYAPVYVWCVDNVGNAGEAANSGILVDLTPPVFTNFTPADGSWHNTTEVECSVEICDEGSGVDGTGVEYAISVGDGHNFDVWLPTGLTMANEILIPNIRHLFQEGEENYIKWRAKDVSGNGYVESFPINIKVDATQVIFAKDLSSPKNWYGSREITSKIKVSDQGIGVNLTSLEASISTKGPGVFGEWMKIEEDNTTELDKGEYEIAFSAFYEEGKNNYVMFRGTDLVGNPYTISKKFNLKVDTSRVYFGDFTPGEDDYSDEQEVECFIQIFDDGSGVDIDTVEYSVSKKGPDVENFGAWKRAENVVGGNPTQVLMDLKFDWGRNNYIRWRAGDVLGTGLNVSPPYRIWINSEPVPLISQPFSESDLWTHQEIAFDAKNSTDLDDDNLTFYWTSNVTSNRSIGSGARIMRKLAPGKHTITLYVNDAHGYNVTEKLSIYVKEKKKDQKEEEKEEGVLFSEDGGISPYMLIAFVVVILLSVLLVIWLVIRKKKKKEETQKAPALPPAAPYSPYSQPYGQQQGQYLSTAGPGYVQQGFVGAISPGSPPSMYPPAGGVPGQFRLPPGSPSVYSSGGVVPSSGAMVCPGFMLPSFPTDQGMQDFARLALPPASVDRDLTGYPETGIAAQQARSQTPFPPGTSSPAPVPPTQGATGVYAPPTQDLSTSAQSSVDGAPQMNLETDVPVQDFSTGNVTPAPGTLAPPMFGSPLPGPPAAEVPAGVPPLPVPDLTPLPPSPEAPQAPMPEPGVPSSNEMTMQCHACGLNYAATVIEFPAVVTCPVCQTQGVIASA